MSRKQKRNVKINKQENPDKFHNIVKYDKIFIFISEKQQKNADSATNHVKTKKMNIDLNMSYDIILNTLDRKELPANKSNTIYAFVADGINAPPLHERGDMVMEFLERLPGSVRSAKHIKCKTSESYKSMVIAELQEAESEDGKAFNVDELMGWLFTKPLPNQLNNDMEILIQSEMWNEDIERMVKYEARVLFNVDAENTEWRRKIAEYRREIQIVKNDELRFNTIEENQLIPRQKVVIQTKGFNVALTAVTNYPAILAEDTMENLTVKVNKAMPISDFNRQFERGLRVRGLMSQLQFAIPLYGNPAEVAIFLAGAEGIDQVLIVNEDTILRKFELAKQTVTENWVQGKITRVLYNILAESVYRGLTFNAIQRFQREGKIDAERWSRELIEWLKSALKMDEDLIVKFVKI